LFLEKKICFDVQNNKYWELDIVCSIICKITINSDL
jgi:hypothetical protein